MPAKAVELSSLLGDNTELRASNYIHIKQFEGLKDLERENAQLKKLVADQALDKSILEEALKGNY